VAVTTSPPPSRGRAVTMPPWARVTARTMDRPRPAPLAVTRRSVPRLLSALGGEGGAVLGAGVTAGYAVYQGWPAVVPPWAMLGGVGATLAIGALAGLYPAVRASRLSPTEALATP
jgi:hypothetical protein